MEQPQARRGPRTWVVVASTLGAVVVAALVFVAGVVVGVVISDRAPATTSQDATAGSAPGGEAEAGGGLDPCLVGRWQTTEHSESAETEQGRLTISGVDRTLDITRDGVETVTYGTRPARAVTDGGEAEVTYAGTVVYGVTTSGDTMAFTLRSADADRVEVTVRSDFVTASGKRETARAVAETGRRLGACIVVTIPGSTTGYETTADCGEITVKVYVDTSGNVTLLTPPGQIKGMFKATLRE